MPQIIKRSLYVLFILLGVLVFGRDNTGGQAARLLMAELLVKSS